LKVHAVHDITFYLDFVSPYSWLAFEQLPKALQGLSVRVRYRPVLLGALLQRMGNVGPAAIAPKRAWTARHVQWLGASLGCGLDMPPQFPFNSLPLLRLALTCSEEGFINRYVAGTVLRHAWLGGHDPLDPARLDALTQALAEQWRPEGDPPRTPRRCCAPTPTKRRRAACSACRCSRWAASCSGGWTACRCCARIWRGMRGSTAPRGRRPHSGLR